jgi:NAD(P)-dependent dehydrogenase (short-subunit alcohol dehydrogenase family)
MSLILITNVLAYAGPGALMSLSQDRHVIACHDASFTEVAVRAQFESQHDNAHALESQSPEEIHEEVLARWGLPDGIVSNDIHPISKNDIENIPIDDFRLTFEAVVVKPIKLTQLFVGAMKLRRSGSFVFITSARETRPEPGFAVPTTLRSATTAFAKALAQEVAPFGIQANVIAPNYLHSELYYPRARFIDDEEGRKEIARIVPFGRLADPKEIGELVAFFATGKSPFTTGQVINFTGGWPQA